MIVFGVAAVLALASTAAADPVSSTDTDYLAALHHGGLCCPEQSDMPISFADPASEISNGHTIARVMGESNNAYGNETYAGFKTLSTTIFKNSHTNSDLRPLNTLQSGEVVLIAVHYYGGQALECALIKDMGDEAGYWYGRPKAVAPYCY
ncbi:DUF732 domain-containing protein [Mycobacterium sp. E1386]|uniref:DUF732 domain-containing protein n=1 Tax=Mycobacterium sp. E1386 TaxID=1834126 RepID=UPI000AED2B26|nr:DUF732 domain-containing protein [Mycobacterium sp. E1386]